METISKNAVIEIIMAGSNLNDSIRILTKDIMKKVNDLPVFENNPPLKTKYVKYFDPDEGVWKIGEVIVE